MTRILDKTFVTEDEMGSPGSAAMTVAGWLEDQLLKLQLDTYNEEYVVRITVDQADNKEI